MWSEARTGLYRFKEEMKTEEEFLAAMKVYQRKVLTYVWALIFVTLGLCLTRTLSYFHVNIPLAGDLWISGIVALPVSCWYFQRYEKKAAMNCGLVCPECSHIMRGTDFKSLKATRLCPQCKKPFFN